jgi:hypothetical protein
MTEKEIVQALRCRARHEKAVNEGCKKCSYWATENLEEWQKLRGWASCKVYQIISDAADAIERLLAENAALREKVAQWISVKDADRRAPAGKRVIATDGVFVGEAYRTSADSWRRYDDYRLWHDATGHTVTHWMPLPEVPEEGET